MWGCTGGSAYPFGGVGGGNTPKVTPPGDAMGNVWGFAIITDAVVALLLSPEDDLKAKKKKDWVIFSFSKVATICFCFYLNQYEGHFKALYIIRLILNRHYF